MVVRNLTHLSQTLDDCPADLAVHDDKPFRLRQLIQRLVVFSDLSAEVGNDTPDLIRQRLLLDPQLDRVLLDENIGVEDGIVGDVGTTKVQEPRDRGERGYQVGGRLVAVGGGEVGG